MASTTYLSIIAQYKTLGVISMFAIQTLSFLNLSIPKNL